MHYVYLGSRETYDRSTFIFNVVWRGSSEVISALASHDKDRWFESEREAPQELVTDSILSWGGRCSTAVILTAPPSSVLADQGKYRH